MTRRLLALLAALVSVASGPAAANPIANQGQFVAVQVPGTSHVQVSYVCICAQGRPGETVSGCTELPEDWSGMWLARDGARVRRPWLGPNAITLNPGSGLADGEGLQVCDCDVPLGEHAYEVHRPVGHAPCAADRRTMTVVDPPPAEPPPWEPPDPDDEEYPWEIEPPPWPKGVDCAAWCASAPPLPDPADVVEAGADAGLDGGADATPAGQDLAADAPAAVDAPAAPDTPGLTDAPAVLDTPAAPDTPAALDTPAAPDTPAVLDMPSPPDAPGPTDTPAVFDAPAPPDTPAVLDTPAPGPDAPSVSDTAGEPDTGGGGCAAAGAGASLPTLLLAGVLVTALRRGRWRTAA